MKDIEKIIRQYVSYQEHAIADAEANPSDYSANYNMQFLKGQIQQGKSMIDDLKSMLKGVIDFDSNTEGE